jgi:SAM-dependent methyltransferase
MSPAGRRRFSLVAHEGMDLWNPLARDAALRVADEIPLGPGARVLDVGCGPATLLLRMLERSGARGVAVDVAEEGLAIARANAQGRVDRSRLEFRAEPFDAAAFGDESFDAALCIGSTHAAGGLTGRSGRCGCSSAPAALRSSARGTGCASRIPATSPSSARTATS